MLFKNLKLKLLKNSKNIFITNFSLYKQFFFKKLYFYIYIKKLKITNNYNSKIINYKFFLKKRINFFNFKRINSFFFKKKFISNNFKFSLKNFIKIWITFIMNKGKYLKVFKKFLIFFNKIFKKFNLNILKIFILIFELIKNIFNSTYLKKNKKKLKLNFNFIYLNKRKQLKIFFKQFFVFEALKKNPFFFLKSFIIFLKKKLYIYSFLTKKKQNIRVYK